MYVKVQMIDDGRTVDLFWIEHTGTDVYCGPSRSRIKWSYHELGEYHVISEGQRLFTHAQLPLKDVVGYVPITGLGLPATPPPRIGRSAKQSSSHRVDARVIIDGRSLDLAAALQITVGVMQRESFESLGGGLARHAALYHAPLFLNQLLLIPVVTPWVVVAVYQGSA